MGELGRKRSPHGSCDKESDATSHGMVLNTWNVPCVRPMGSFNGYITAPRDHPMGTTSSQGSCNEEHHETFHGTIYETLGTVRWVCPIDTIASHEIVILAQYRHIRTLSSHGYNSVPLIVVWDEVQYMGRPMRSFHGHNIVPLVVSFKIHMKPHGNMLNPCDASWDRPIGTKTAHGMVPWARYRYMGRSMRNPRDVRMSKKLVPSVVLCGIT